MPESSSIPLQLARYLIGCLLGAIIGALAVWQWAHDDADKVLRDWEAAAVAQQAAERKRTDAITRRMADDHNRAVVELRRRLASGWRPTIPASSSVSSGGVSQTPTGTDEAATAELPAPAGNEARLIEDGQATVLQCQALQEWVEQVGRQPAMQAMKLE